jgi:hypothetical protein
VNATGKIARPVCGVGRLGHSKQMGHLPLEIGPKVICFVQQLVTVAAMKPNLVRGEEQYDRNDSF